MQQPYYGAPPPGYPPASQAAYGAPPPQQYYPPQPGYYQVPPPSIGSYMTQQPPPIYGGPGYEDDRYWRGSNDSRRDRGGAGKKGRGRSRSPSQDRSRRTAGRSENKSSIGAITLPPLKPGEATFALLVPAFGINSHLPAFKDIGTANNVTITLLDETPGGSATRRSLRFIGTWENLRPAQQQVLDVLKQNAKLDQVFSEETLVLIPRDRSQNLTQSLSEIQTSTNTTIEVFPARGGADANMALVVVSSQAPEGTSDEDQKKAESDAVARIKECLDIKLLPSELPEDSESWSKVYIPVSSRFAGSVMGKNASVIRELETETKAKINLSREGTKAETPLEVYRFVTAEGTGEQVKLAHARVMELIQAAKDRARAEAKDGSTMKIPLAVADQLIGVIIGRSGKVLRDLQEDTGTKIHIEHSGKDDRTAASTRLVEISGEPEKVEKAQMIVVERLTQAILDQQASSSSRSRARSRSPSEKRRERPPPLREGLGTRPPPSVVAATSKPGEELDTMVIAVPIQQAGAVIGNRGETVRQICEESGARIHIEERDKLAPDATERAVTITGTTSQVAKAFSLIQAALAEANDPRKTANKEERGRGGGSSRSGNRDPYASSAPPGYGSAPPPHYHSSMPPAYGQPPPMQQHPQHSYYQPPPSHQSSAPPPLVPPATSYYGGYQPSRQLPSLEPLHGVPPQQQHPSQPQQQNSQFDLSILTQLAKNLPPIGSGVITQITGSPQNPNQQHQQQQQQQQQYQHQDYRGYNM